MIIILYNRELPLSKYDKIGDLSNKNRDIMLTNAKEIHSTKITKLLFKTLNTKRWSKKLFSSISELRRAKFNEEVENTLN